MKSYEIQRTWASDLYELQLVCHAHGGLKDKVVHYLCGIFPIVMWINGARFSSYLYTPFSIFMACAWPVWKLVAIRVDSLLIIDLKEKITLDGGLGGSLWQSWGNFLHRCLWIRCQAARFGLAWKISLFYPHMNEDEWAEGLLSAMSGWRDFWREEGVWFLERVLKASFILFLLKMGMNDWFGKM